MAFSDPRPRAEVTPRRPSRATREKRMEEVHERVAREWEQMTPEERRARAAQDIRELFGD